MGRAVHRFLGNKAISEVISVLLIVLMGISLVGTAYMWGMPMISKRQDAARMDRLYSYFDRSNSNSLVRKIEFIAKNGGEDTFTSDVDGLWTFHEYSEGNENNNSIEFLTFSRVSSIAVLGDWVALTPGGSCPPEGGLVGIDGSSVTCAKAESFEDGFNIVYRIWFRELSEATGTKAYKINLVKHPSGQLSSTSTRVRISREDVTSQEQNGKTLIITEIKILLV